MQEFSTSLLEDLKTYHDQLKVGGTAHAEPVRLVADTILRLVALEVALREAIEGWEDGASYKGEYLRTKHRDAEGIAEAREVLNCRQ